MKIGMADNAGLKFCNDLKEHWESLGHEVRYERGASEYLAQWADLYYVEWIDGNLNYLWKIYNGADGVSRTPDWDNNKKPKIACRMIDWDIWNAYVPFYEQNYIDFIDKAICIVPHIEQYIREKAPQYGDKLKLIRPGVNLDKFPFNKEEPKTDGFQIGMVLGDMWWYKNHMGGLDIFKTLADRDPRWHLHIRGQHEPGAYNPVMFDHYLESRDIKDRVTLYSSFPDMNEFYDKIDILLHPGMKETFCYAVAEAMAKGKQVVVNEFYGSRAVWPMNILYKTHAEAVDMISHNMNGKWLHQANHDFIATHYPNDKMFKEIDAWLEVPHE